MKLLAIAIRNVARSGRRSILSGFAIALSTLLCIFMVSFIMGVVDDYDSMLLNYSTGMIQVRDKRFYEYDYLNPVQYYVQNEAAVRTRALQIDGALQAVSRIHIPGKLYFSGEQKNRESKGYGLAVDFNNEVMDFEGMLLEGRYPLSSKKETVIGAKLAERNNLKTGDKITVLTSTASRGSNAMTFRISGIIAFPNTVMTQWFLIPFNWGQTLTGMPGGSSEVLLYLEDIKKTDAARADWQSQLPDYLEARSYSDLNLMFNYMRLGKFIYFMMAGFFVLLGCTVIINTMMMLVYERIREIGILSAMGLSSREVARLFFLEALFISIISAVIGMSLGAWLVYKTGQLGINIGNMEFFDNVNLDYPMVFRPVLSIKAILISAFMAIGITSIVAAIPARKAAKMKPVDALNA